MSPLLSRARDRRLEPEEITRFWRAVDRARAVWVTPFIILAIETGMRRAELLAVEWKDVDASGRLVHVTMAKTGYKRTVPLTPVAVQVLASMPRHHRFLFTAKPGAVRQAWERLVRRAGIQGLRLHDLRHEAVSRFFEYGLSVPEVALISGHRDPRMLARYTHLRPEHVAEKLAKVLPSSRP